MSSVISVARHHFPDAYEAMAESDVKVAQRHKVVEYLLRNHPPGMRPRFFGLPGLHWSTEQLLDAAWKHRGQFVGVERNWGVLEKARPYMPGHKVSHFVEQMKHGQIDCLKSSRAHLLHYELEDFLDVNVELHRNAGGKTRWRKCYKQWTCCWIDGWSPLGGRLVPALRKLEQHVAGRALSVPAAVTFLVGRDTDSAVYEGLADSYSALEKRARALRRILNAGPYRSFELDDCWQYASPGGVSMGVALGRLIRRQPI